MEELEQKRKEIGIRLELFRAHLQMDKIQFAESLDTSYNTYRSIASGQRQVSATLLILVAEKYLDVSLNWLMRGEGAMLVVHEDPTAKESASAKFDALKKEYNLAMMELKFLKEQASSAEIQIRLLKEFNEQLKNDRTGTELTKD